MRLRRSPGLLAGPAPASICPAHSSRPRQYIFCVSHPRAHAARWALKYLARSLRSASGLEAALTPGPTRADIHDAPPVPPAGAYPLVCAFVPATSVSSAPLHLLPRAIPSLPHARQTASSPLFLPCCARIMQVTDLLNNRCIPATIDPPRKYSWMTSETQSTCLSELVQVPLPVPASANPAPPVLYRFRTPFVMLGAAPAPPRTSAHFQWMSPPHMPFLIRRFGRFPASATTCLQPLEYCAPGEERLECLFTVPLLKPRRARYQRGRRIPCAPCFERGVVLSPLRTHLSAVYMLEQYRAHPLKLNPPRSRTSCLFLSTPATFIHASLPLPLHVHGEIATLLPPVLNSEG